MCKTNKNSAIQDPVYTNMIYKPGHHPGKRLVFNPEPNIVKWPNQGANNDPTQCLFSLHRSEAYGQKFHARTKSWPVYNFT